MARFILRRLVQAVLTLFGVMLLTFVLFRLVAGDVTAQFVNPKLGKEARVAWLRKNKLDLPMVFNLQRRLLIADRSQGEEDFTVRDAGDSKVVSALMLARQAGPRPGEDLPGERPGPVVVSEAVQLLSEDTPLTQLTAGDPWVAEPDRSGQGPIESAPQSRPATQPTSPPTTSRAAATAEPPKPVLIFGLRDGSGFRVELSALSAQREGIVGPAEGATCGDLMRLINGHPDNRGRVKVSISKLSAANVFNSQFFWHLWHSATFSNRSFKTNELLQEIIAKRAKFSLAITVPAMAMGWLLAIIVASIVAYYRAGLIDRLGVFVCVLGMCVPYLVYMIAGQALVFEVAPGAAWGLHNPANIYVPVAIAVIAGLGASVRFYRTVILDEVSRDYVRTARAKGVPLYGILFRHVLRNCMLPILTALVVSIPFLIMGSLLLEQFFGVPGLGSLMLNSVYDRDVPMISGLTFLTAAVYIAGLLITDLLYAVFDPRIRLR